MKDENETYDAAHWQALAESLKSDDEPPRQAEVIRAQFRREPEAGKDGRTTDDAAQASDKARLPATEKPRDKAQSVGRMSRPELVAYLRSALATLEQSRAAQDERTTAEPDPETAEPDSENMDQAQSSAKPTPLVDRTALPVSTPLPVSKTPDGPQSEESTSEEPTSEEPTGESRAHPGIPADIPERSENGSALGDGVVTKAARLLVADEQLSPSDTPSDDAEPAPASAGEQRDPDATGEAPSLIPAPKQRLQFSQEVPDFLRSRDIAWPGATKTARKDWDAFRTGQTQDVVSGTDPGSTRSATTVGQKQRCPGAVEAASATRLNICGGCSDFDLAGRRSVGRNKVGNIGARLGGGIGSIGALSGGQCHCGRRPQDRSYRSGIAALR